jgi:hypothetical protein
MSTHVQKVTNVIPGHVKDKIHKHSFPLAFFIIVQVVYVCINFYEFTVVTILGRLIQLQLLIFIVYQIGSRIMLNTTHFEFPYGFKTERHILDPIVNYIEFYSNTLGDYILVKKPLQTLKFIIVLQLVCVLGKIFSGSTFIYLILNWFIIAPVVYEYQHEKIDALFVLMQSQINQVLELVNSKLPPQIKQALLDFSKKME